MFDIENKKQVIPFEEIDPYNLQNKLKGYINRRQGNLYGALLITHVNGKPCKQLIYSAPKQHYPFDKDNNWEFPEYDSIELYEKLDGTCIISYRYTDGESWFHTYKTRLRPFLGTGKYGNFFSLWNEMLEKYPIIKEECEAVGSYNYIFELYGKRNKILIDYTVPLDTRLIFVISPNGDIISPDSTRGIDVPMLNSEITITDIDSDYYIQIQNRLEEELIVDEENQIIKGKEGYVMYFIKDRKCTQIKNKPPSILKYHWSGSSIPYESLLTTTYNAFENFDEPTYEDIVSLLQEEYSEDIIEKSKVRIEKVLGKVLFDKKFQYRLVEDYKNLGVTLAEDKAKVMRWFGQNYPKSEAKRIYNLLSMYEK